MFCLSRGCTGTGEIVKIFFSSITMKLASLVELAVLIIYHQGRKKIDRKVFVFCKTCQKINFTSDSNSDWTCISRYGVILHTLPRPPIYQIDQFTSENNNDALFPDLLPFSNFLSYGNFIGSNGFGTPDSNCPEVSNESYPRTFNFNHDLIGMINLRVERMFEQMQVGGVRLAKCSMMSCVTVESHSKFLLFFFIICGVSFCWDTTVDIG